MGVKGGVTRELAGLQHCGKPMLAVGSCHVGKESHSLAVHFDRHRCGGVRACVWAGEPFAGAQKRAAMCEWALWG